MPPSMVIWTDFAMTSGALESFFLGKNTGDTSKLGKKNATCGTAPTNGREDFPYYVVVFSKHQLSSGEPAVVGVWCGSGNTGDGKGSAEPGTDECWLHVEWESFVGLASYSKALG